MRKKPHYMFVIVIVLLLFILSSCTNASESEKNIPAKDNYKAINDSYHFKLADLNGINEDNQPIALKDYNGEVFLVDMIFTSCTTICSPMTSQLSRLQNTLKEDNLNIQFVSLSVDTTVDTPDKLKEFAQKFNVDLNTWDFLTGYSYEDIKKVAKSVKTLVEKNEDSDQVMHSSRVYLIDQYGYAVKDYSGIHIPYDQIEKDIKKLLR